MYKVLVADDESIERKAISLILKKSNNIELIGEAKNGIDAIEQVKNLNPHIVLMDIKMPEMDGLQATKEILKINPKIKTIILTAYDEFQYAQQAIRAGAVDYLLKPARPVDLLKSINDAILNSKPDTFSIVEKDIKAFLDVDKNNFLFEKIKIQDKLAVKSEINKIIDNNFNNDIDNLKKFVVILFIKLIDIISNEYNVNDEKLVTLGNKFSNELNLIQDFEKVKDLINEYTEKLFEITLNNDITPYEPLLIKKALQYIDQNFNKNITLESVAKYVHLNPQYFSKYFKNAMNMNFVDYVSKMRINYSKKLLSETDLSINVISLKAGYMDCSYFCKVFKKYEGISPHKYREQKHLNKSN